MPRLIAFGGLSVENGVLSNGVANPRSRLAILAVLAVSGERGIRREKLGALFWPESTEERARNALRQALFTLRRDIGAGDITLGTSDLRLNPDVLTADVSEFDAAMRTGRHETAVTLYKGPFLDGVFVREAPEFERWVEAQRHRLSEEYGRALDALADGALAREDAAGAAQWLGRRALHDPLSARVARRYLDSLVAIGDRASALRHAATYVRTVRSELATEPDPDILAYIERLRVSEHAIQVPLPIPPEDHHETTPSSFARDGRDAARPGRFPRRLGSVAAALAAVAVVAVMPRAQLTVAPERAIEPNRVMVAGFVNQIADSTFSALGELVADQIVDGLLRSGVAEAVDPATSFYAVRDVRQADTMPGSDAARLQALAEAGGAGIVVTGRIDEIGDSVLFQALVSEADGRAIGAVRVGSTRLLASTSGIGNVRAQVAGLIASRLDRAVEHVVGASASPPRLDAYRDFVRGLEAFQQYDYRSALDAFLQAAAADSEFVPPVVWARYAAENGGIQPTRDSIAAVATHLISARASRISRFERYSLLRVSSLADSSSGVEEEAITHAAHLAPGSSFSFELGALRKDRFRYREAVTAFEEVDTRRGWARGWLYDREQLVRALHLLGEDDRALTVARQSVAMNPTNPIGYMLLLMPLASRGRVEAVNDVLNQAEEAQVKCCKWGKLYWAFLFAIGELADHGYQAEADDMLHRAKAWYADHPEFVSLEGSAHLAYQARRWREADSLFRELFTDAGEGTVVGQAYANEVLAGFWSVALVNLGRVTGADSLQRRWFGDRAGPRRTRASKALQRAQLSAAKGDADVAVGFLRESLAEGGVDSWDISHGPGWDPIRNAKVYRDFIKPR